MMMTFFKKICLVKGTRWRKRKLKKSDSLLISTSVCLRLGTLSLKRGQNKVTKLIKWQRMVVMGLIKTK